MTPSKRERVVGLGEILWDLLPEGKQPGGATANFAWRARKGGADACIVTAVGDDDLGRGLRERLDAWGLGQRYVTVDPDHPTGSVTVAFGDDGAPDYTIHENVAWDHIPWTPDTEALAGTVDAVCIGTLGQRAPVSRRTIRLFLDATPPDALRVYDVNLRRTGDSPDLVLGTLPFVNVLKLNDSELPRVAAMTGLSGDDREVLRGLVERYALRLAALTRGGAGSLLVSPSEASDHPGHPVEVVDTIGAGDAFTAAMALGLLRGEPLEAISDAANRAAAEACTHPGGIPDAPAPGVRPRTG